MKCLECTKEVDEKRFCKECFIYIEEGDYYQGRSE